MKYRVVDPDFWNDPVLLGWDRELRNHYLYHFTNKHIDLAGVIRTAPEILAVETKLQIKKFMKLEYELQEKGKLVIFDKYIWVTKFISHQNINNRNTRIGIIRCYNEIRDEGLKKIIGKYYEIAEEGITYIGKGQPEQGREGMIIVSEGKTYVEKEKKPLKHKIAEAVSLTEEEHDKLFEIYGTMLLKEIVEKLNNYKLQTGKTYKSDYRAILNWCGPAILQEHRLPKNYNHARIYQKKQEARRKQEEILERDKGKKLSPEELKKIREENMGKMKELIAGTKKGIVK